MLSSKLFIGSRCKYLEIKAEMCISWLIFIFWCQTQMFPVYSKNKGIGLTVPILMEGTVYNPFHLFGNSVLMLCNSGLNMYNNSFIVKSLDAPSLARFVCRQDENEEDSSNGNDSGKRLWAWYVVRYNDACFQLIYIPQNSIAWMCDVWLLDQQLEISYSF